MDKKATIPFKAVAELAMPDVCHRCFAVKNRYKMPFTIFPGVFNTLDKHCKELFLEAFPVDTETPIPMLGRQLATKLFPEHPKAEWHSVPCPHWSKFYIETDRIIARGSSDHILKTRVEELMAILDSKVSRKTDNQDKLGPMYRLQVNLYRGAAASTGMGTADMLGLVYFDPENRGPIARADGHIVMPVEFEVKMVPVDIMPAKDVADYLDLAADLILGDIPAGNDGCKECKKLDALVEGLRNAA